MAEIGGWNFWVETDGKVRLFVVAGADERTAQATLEAHAPELKDTNIVSRQQLPSSEIALFGMSPGEVREMVPGTESNKLDEGGVDLKRPI